MKTKIEQRIHGDFHSFQTFNVAAKPKFDLKKKSHKNAFRIIFYITQKSLFFSKKKCLEECLGIKFFSIL
jgi:hypothetical protein